MYNSLTGMVTSMRNDSCCLDVNGAEYILTITWTLREQLSPGERRRILVYLLHREDQMRLFGFAAEEERDLFMRLMKVSGVGAALAVKILSGMSLPRLATAIESGDVNALSSIPGLGKKTAQKIILGLQGTLVSSQDGEPSPWADIASALSDMGFERTAAAAAVQRAAENLPPRMEAKDAEEFILREAIVVLSKSGGG